MESFKDDRVPPNRPWTNRSSAPPSDFGFFFGASRMPAKPAANKPCVYVGCTGLTPEERFARHKAGIRASTYVRKYGVRLLPRLYAYANPMPYEAAREMEVELAIALQAEGYAVWQA